MMEECYRIEIDGVMMYEEYDSAGKAKAGAAIYLKKYPSFSRARLVRCVKEYTGEEFVNRKEKGILVV